MGVQDWSNFKIGSGVWLMSSATGTTSCRCPLVITLAPAVAAPPPCPVLVVLAVTASPLHRHLLYDKELLEYRHWLEGVAGFVSK